MVSVHPWFRYSFIVINRCAGGPGHTQPMTTKPIAIPTITPTSKIAQAISFRVLNSLTSGFGCIVKARICPRPRLTGRAPL
jgi:hypothetical protein